VHIMTGPIYVCGAEPGDVLQVDILDLFPRKNPKTGKVRWDHTRAALQACPAGGQLAGIITNLMLCSSMGGVEQKC